MSRFESGAGWLGVHWDTPCGAPYPVPIDEILYERDDHAHIAAKNTYVRIHGSRLSRIQISVHGLNSTLGLPVTRVGASMVLFTT
jgi:hypothetical protein